MVAQDRLLSRALLNTRGHRNFGEQQPWDCGVSSHQEPGRGKIQGLLVWEVLRVCEVNERGIKHIHMCYL